MAEIAYQKNKQKAKQVLILYAKLLVLQDSCWGQLFLFQKTQLFQSFNKRFRLKDVLQIRLEDLIYLTLLGGLMGMFNMIASDGNNLLFVGYRIFCLIMFLCSMICLMIGPSIKYLLLLIFCVLIPVLMNGIYSKWISLDPTASLDTYSYVGYLSMLIVFVFCLLVYPLKSLIQTKIGSLYSYLYGLSVIGLMGLWPFYCLIQEMISSGSITIQLIYKNKALVITFLVIIVLSFYLIVHKTFFEGDKQRLYEVLKSLFSSQEINKATEQMEHKEIEEYKWHNITSRVMSLVVLSTTLGLEIFIFFKMQDSSRNMANSVSLMVFAVIFLILGTFYIVVPISNKFAIPIFTVLSLAPAPLSFYYSQSFQYWEYICTIFSLPYAILFWSVIRGISQYKPLLQNKILTIMYIFIHIPIMVFVMDVLNYFNSGNKIGPVGYVSIIIVMLTTVLATLISIVMFCIRICAVKDQNTKNTTQLDFNFEQPLNYQPYKKSNTLTLTWVAQMDLREVGIFLNSLFYLTFNVVVFYSLNELIYTYTPSYFFSSSIYELTYAEFIILFVFMLYSHYFMSTNNDTWDFWMLTAWFVTGAIFIILSFILTVIPTTFRLFGGFCLIMFFIAIAFEYIKDSNKKIIPFVAPVLIASLWITVVIPYVVGIPTTSIYVNQTDFGIFIYECILASALLLIILVGIVSMIFNILMNKFQQQKRYKYVIQDVKQFLDQEGVQSNDEVLHVFHQAYECRNKKYVFYLKNGYPINVIKDQENQEFKLVTYDNYVSKKTTQILPRNNQNQPDCCWCCLTFFCGEDEEQINEKMKYALENNLINEEQAENLFPDEKLQRFNKMMKAKTFQKKKEKINRIKPEDISSTKSLLLNTMVEGPRRLGPQFTLLKLENSRRLALQIWSSIFQFISNTDKGQNMIIYNDFKKFCDISQLQIQNKDCQHLFNNYAKSSWGDTVGMNEEQFATALQDIADKCYHDIVEEEEQRLMSLLIEKVYYNMVRYEEFNQLRRNYNSKKFSIKSSIFNGSLQRFKESQKQRQKQVSQLVHFYKKQKNHLKEPQKQYDANDSKKKKQSHNDLVENDVQAQKGNSYKKVIYENFIRVRNSCSNAVPQEENKVVKRNKIKPWHYLATESAKILHRKDLLWEDQHQVKEYEFRLIFNNIIMALFKLADLYAYLEITIKDPHVKWYEDAKFSFLYIDYKYQLYLCLALAFITIPLGIKGISFISEDRLGLTQARVPAGFPHPMFFYTVIYKLLVLSLFATISSTFLLTFSCTWTKTSPYKLYQDPSIQCLSTEHNIYIMLSLIFLILYFPLSSYTFPNFQFSEKRLDLKYRPSYLVLYFQINFVLVVNKVLLSEAGSNETVEIAFISINIISLLFLSVVCLKMKPCLIEWFNWIEFLTIFLGLIWNIGGLVLYLTKMWTLCVIVFGALSVVSIITVALVIKKFHFSIATVNVQNDEDEVKQLQLGRRYNKNKNKLMIGQRHSADKNDVQLDKRNTFMEARSKNKGDKDKELIPVEDIFSNTDEGQQNQMQFSTIEARIK